MNGEMIEVNNSEMMTTKETNDESKSLVSGRGVYISTYGCQMNVNDTERMYSLLEMSNYNPVDTPEKADVIIINSCSIREKPVHKVYSEVGTFRKLKEKNPNLRIGIGGCVGQQEKENLIKRQPLIDFVFGTDNIDAIPQYLRELEDLRETEARKKEKLVRARFDHQSPYHIETLVRNPGVATFVNITKGCDNFCSFCVVPYTRGREKSRPLSHVLQDVKNLVQRGVKEVTLLGQNVNSYTSECGANFGQLIDEVAQKTNIERIRFTTSHPKDFNAELVDIMARNPEKVCEYIHLPVQSGSTSILAQMNRGYTREEYLEKVQMIRNRFPQVVFSTDIIVGFPGETEVDFQDTLNMVEAVGYETIFAFMYSPRPLTKAARFENQVEESVKSERLQRLFEFHNKLSFELVKKYEGQTLMVLVEKSEERNMDETANPEVLPTLSGRSTQNKLVYFIGSSALVGQTVPVRILKAFPAVLRGELIIT